MATYQNKEEELEHRIEILEKRLMIVEKILNEASSKTPSVSENEGKKRICPRCKGTGYTRTVIGYGRRCVKCKATGQI